jgi:hypothetical protein
MFKGDSADMCAGKFPLTSMGGRAEGLACADPGARNPIGVSGFFFVLMGALGYCTHNLIVSSFGNSDDKEEDVNSNWIYLA